MKNKMNVKKWGTLFKWAICAVILALLTEYLMILDFSQVSVEYENETPTSFYSTGNVEILNAAVTGPHVVNGEDSQVLLQDFGGYVGTLEIRLANLSCSALSIQLYYASEGEDFSEENSVTVTYLESQNVLFIPVYERAEDLRIDMGEDEGASYNLIEMIVNPGPLRILKHTIFNMSWIRVVFYFLIIFGIFAAASDWKKFKAWIFRYRWAVGVGFIALCTVLKIHGSSIGYLSEIFNAGDTSRLWGTARDVRTDEYVVFTEMALSQVKSGFQWFSDIWGYGSTDMFMVYGQPVKSLATLYRPFSAMYILLGAEYGLAFYWSSRLVVLFLVSFEFGRILTKDRRGLSVVYAFMISFAPVVQWWYSINELVEMLLFGQLALIIVYYYIRTTSWGRKALMTAAMIFCAGGYVMTLYPAWMIPFLYVFAGCGIAILVEDRKMIKVRWGDLVLWIIGIVILVGSMYYIFSTSWDTVQAEMNTYYPGARTYSGMITDIMRLFRGWISGIWTFVDIQNPCENVDFISLFPLGIILSVLVLFRKKQKDIWLIILNILNILMIIFYLGFLPEVVSQVTLLSHSTSRMENAIGLLNGMILIRSMTWSTDAFKYVKKILPCALPLTGLSLLALLNGNDINSAARCLVFLATGVMIYLVLNYEKKACMNVFIAAMILLHLAGGGLVNPVETGLDTLYDLDLVQRIDKINSEEPGLWIVGGDISYGANLPTVVGAKTLNAVATYPNRKLWEELGLDDEENEKIWNRYAHIRVLVTEDETWLELQNADALTLHISVADLAKIGVKYILQPAGMPLENDVTELDSANVMVIYRIDPAS